MRLPFTSQQFFDVFGAYNAAAWPAVVALWLATLVCSVGLVRRRASPGALSALAAIHWLWSGVVYHAMFFAAINPAAWLFAAMFVLEGAAFAWVGMKMRPTFDLDRTASAWVGAVFLACSLAYPFLALLSGHLLPRVPLFAVPCPTTVFTIGLLLNARGVPAIVAVIPGLWALIGGTAAVLLGVTPDLMLFAAAGALVVCTVSQSARRTQSAIHFR